MPSTHSAKRRKLSHTTPSDPTTPTPQPPADDSTTLRRSSTRRKTPTAKLAAVARTPTASPLSITRPSTRKRATAVAATNQDKHTEQHEAADEDDDDEIEVQSAQPAKKRGPGRPPGARTKAKPGPLKEGQGNTLTPARKSARAVESDDDDVDELGEADDIYALPVSPMKSLKGKGKAKAKVWSPLVEGVSTSRTRTREEPESPAPLDEPLYDQQIEEPSYITASEGEGEETTTIPNEVPPDPRFEALKHIALSRTTQKLPVPLTNLAEEHAKVHTLLAQTVAAGEGNSMLLIGARGTGKTALVNAILRDLAREHEGSFHVIRLNGFMQTDDKLALREIWRQLGREMAVDDDDDGKPGVRGSNYADTLAKLLQLLSHPDELLPQSFSTADAAAHGKLAETQQQDASAIAAKSVVFIMDEFDLFATHPRQTLLYNLFDIAQSRKAPIAILGLTTRIDVAESLEKRVKSRFSHRYVHLPLPRSFKHLEDVCAAALTVTAADLDNADIKETEALSPIWNATVIKHLLYSPAQQRILRHIFATTRSVPEALTSLILPLSVFSPSSPSAPALGRIDTALLPPQSSLHVLPSLSTLQQGLLIAAARLEIILSSSSTALALAPMSGACNFNAAYAEYVDLVARARLTASVSSASGLAAGGAAALGGAAIGGRVWGREVARAAWESLRRAGLLVAVSSGGGGGFGFGGIGGGAGAGGALKVDELVRCDVALEEIEGAVDAGWRAGQGAEKMPAGLRKWCREI